MSKRIIFTIMLFFVIFLIPWWGVLLLSLVGIFYFKDYYEALALGVLFDVLHGIGGRVSFGYGVVGLSVMIASFLFVNRMKQKLR